MAFEPSHANAVPYALLSFLANCAKSSHNHFALATNDLVMIDNDRCFVPNSVLLGFAPAAAAKARDAEKASAGSSDGTNGLPEIPSEHSERFTRWRGMLWASCAWLGPNYDPMRGGARERYPRVEEASGGNGGNSVEDMLARLRWHAKLQHPPLSQALASLLAEDTLAEALLAGRGTTPPAWLKELDARAAELLDRVEQCEAQREAYAVHEWRSGERVASEGLRSPEVERWCRSNGDLPRVDVCDEHEPVMAA
jgi:hypothetical protein